jgi:predicted nucleic acid-binding protein
VQIVDTNIVVNLLVAGPYSDSARALYAVDADWHSESLLTIAFSNVMATLIRRLNFPLTEASATLAEAKRLLSAGLHQVDDSDALHAAAHFGVTAYDARFLLVARALGSPLITEDAKLRRAAPQFTQSLAEALAAVAGN